MSGTWYPITGCRTGQNADGTWPPRKEFDEFIKDKKQAVLFFIALEKLCTRELKDTLSFFQLGGIHGLPIRPWPHDATNSGTGSYCVHNNPTFVTWHRVYCLLFEQALHDIIMRLVDPESADSPIDKNERPDWLHAAETWRMPYWDFALRRTYNGGKACVPEQAMIDGDPILPLTMSTSGVKLFPTLPTFANNPLYAYRYPLGPGKTLEEYGIVDVITPEDITPKATMPLTIQQRTVRHAPLYNPENASIRKIWVEGISNVKRLKETFSERTLTWRANLTSLFRYSRSFDEFALGENGIPTLNGIHGDVHNAIGGGISNGNMGRVASAGLDPIFFLYHTGIDRLAALWQAGYPDATDPKSWMTKNQKDPLTPFRKADNTFFNSNDVRDWTAWGYSYTDTRKITDYNSMVNKVFKIYGERGGRGNRAAAPGVPNFPLLTPDYVFSCSFLTNKIGPFVLRIYVDIEGTKHIVGGIVNFVASLNSGCDNCNNGLESGHTTISSTYITPELKVLSNKHLIPPFGVKIEQLKALEAFLVKSLKWGLSTPNSPDEEVDIGTTLPSLKVLVTRRDKEFREGYDPKKDTDKHDIPKFIPPAEVVSVVPLPEITTGKPGGLGEGEKMLSGTHETQTIS